MRLVSILMASLALATPVVASVYTDFVKVWDARDRSYRSERDALERRAQSTAERAIDALVNSDPVAGDDLILAFSAAWSLSELVGRGQMLHAFREHMADKPSAALSELWMQGKIDELRRRQAEADMIEAEMQILQGRDTISVKQWIAAHERLAMMRGDISGQATELALINQNLVTYYRARAEQPSLGAALMAAALVGVASSVREKQEGTRDRSAHCARTGNCK